MGEMRGHFLHRDQVGFGAELARGLDHLRKAARRMQHQLVRQHHRERRVAEGVGGGPRRVAEPERRLLPRETHGAGFGLVAGQNLHLGLLAAGGERGVEFEHPVEMVLDHPLVAAGDKNEMLDPGLPGLVDHILDARLGDDGQHFLRHRLGGGQDPGAETGNRKNGFADFHGGRAALKSVRKGAFDRALVAGLPPGTKTLVWSATDREAHRNSGLRYPVPGPAAAGQETTTQISPLLSDWKPGRGLLKRDMPGQRGVDMTGRTKQLASRRTAAAMIAAALLLSGEACAQPSSGGPLSFFDNIFTGTLSKGSQAAPSPQRPAASAQGRAAPAASNPAPPWSSEDGAPGHPLVDP